MKARMFGLLGIAAIMFLLVAILSARISREKNGPLFSGVLTPHAVAGASKGPAELKTRAVVLIVMDGFR